MLYFAVTLLLITLFYCSNHIPTIACINLPNMYYVDLDMKIEIVSQSMLGVMDFGI